MLYTLCVAAVCYLMLYTLCAVLSEPFLYTLCARCCTLYAWIRGAFTDLSTRMGWDISLHRGPADQDFVRASTRGPFEPDGTLVHIAFGSTSLGAGCRPMLRIASLSRLAERILGVESTSRWFIRLRLV